MKNIIKNKKFSTVFSTGFIILLMVVVLGISFGLLINQSLRLDESQSVWQSSRTTGELLNIVSADVHVPGYHLILHLWMGIVGTDIQVLRVLSLIFFVLSIPVVYLLSNYAFKSRALALFTTLMVALSPFLNWYANELRMYSLLTLIVLINQYAFLKLFREGKSSNWQLYTLTAVLGVYIHYFFFPYLATQVVFYLLYRKLFTQIKFRYFIATAVMVAIGFAPWVYYVLNRDSASSTSPLLIRPSTSDLFNTLNQFVFGFQSNNVNSAILSLWPIITLLAFLLLRRVRSQLKPEVVFFLLNAFFPIVAAFVFSLFIRPFFVSRYLVFTIPSLYIVISYILTWYPPKLANFLRIVLVGGMIVGLILQSRTFYSPVQEDYESAANYLEENANYSDIIVLSAPFTIYPFEYYYQGDTLISTLPIWDRTASGSIPPFSQDVLQSDLEKLKDGHDNLWLLLSYDQGYKEDLRLYFDNNFERIDQKTFSPGLDLYAYRVNYR